MHLGKLWYIILTAFHNISVSCSGRIEDLVDRGIIEVAPVDRRSTDPVIARRFAEATCLSDNRDDLKKIDLPTLIMQCSEDIVAPYEVGAYMHENIKNSVLKVLKATGHCPHMSHPEETIEVIREILTTRMNK